jgi:DNA-binding transcriptional MerR regulator
MLTIGRLAKATGISTDAIRFYERVQLLAPAGRTDTGYRLYTESDVRRLAFIKQAQLCGLSLEVIRELLQTVEGPDPRACAAYRTAMAEKKSLDRKLEALRTMRDALGAFIARCEAGNARAVIAGAHSDHDALEKTPETVPWPEPVSSTAAARNEPLHPSGPRARFT